MSLSGRVDRIDRNLRTGEWILIDYKTGDGGVKLSDALRRDGTWRDPQLPLYRFLLPSLVTEEGPLDPPPGPGERVRVGYLSISRSKANIDVLIPDWSEADFESALDTSKDAIRSLLTQQTVRFDPATSGRGARDRMAAVLGRGLLQDPEAGTP